MPQWKLASSPATAHPLAQLQAPSVQIHRWLLGHRGTQPWVVTGIGYWGTSPPETLLPAKRTCENFLPRHPKTGRAKSLQVVLSTDVIDRISGPPKVLATHFW